MQLESNTLHKAGNHIVSIGRDGHQLAICSANTHKVVFLSKTKTNKRLRKIKREFKLWLCDTEQFFFERMSKEQQIRIIDILKGKK